MDNHMEYRVWEAWEVRAIRRTKRQQKDHMIDLNSQFFTWTAPQLAQLSFVKMLKHGFSS